MNEPTVDCLALSTCGNLLGVCDRDKRLLLYRKANVNEWNLASTRMIVKRSTKLEFSSDNKSLVVADRSGCVYQFLSEDDAGDSENDNEPIMGHLSMILDMVII